MQAGRLAQVIQLSMPKGAVPWSLLGSVFGDNLFG